MSAPQSGCQPPGFLAVHLPINNKFGVKRLIGESEPGIIPTGLSFIIFATSVHKVRNSAGDRQGNFHHEIVIPAEGITFTGQTNVTGTKPITT